MNESIKLFFLGYVSGLFTALICACGCYIYGRRVRKSCTDNGSVEDTERKQSATCEELAANEQTAARLIQEAEDILHNGLHTNNN